MAALQECGVAVVCMVVGYALQRAIARTTPVTSLGELRIEN